MKLLLLDRFKNFHFSSPNPQTSKTSSSWLIKRYTVEDILKVILFFSYNLLQSLQQAVINRVEKRILEVFFGDTPRKLISTSTSKINEFDSKTWFYSKLKFLVEILKRLATYFIKVTQFTVIQTNNSFFDI